MWIRAHAALALGRNLGEFGFEAAAGVEEFFRPIALHPLFQDFYVLGFLVHFAHGHLVRAPGILSTFAVDFLRARPSFGRSQNDHRPAWALGDALLSGGV